jgi:hypothetical protein
MGLHVARTPEEFAARYESVMSIIRSLSLLAGYAYTQFTDTYREVNGLLSMERTPKLPLDAVNEANRGIHETREEQLQHLWEERMETFRREQNIMPADRGWVESADFSQVLD